MNRDQRNKEAQIEGALRRYEEDLKAAEVKAIRHLRRCGFNFSSIQQARQYQGKLRALARAQADLLLDATGEPA